MTPRDTPPFRADHVGSLLRPANLLAARAAHAAGEIDITALRAAEDEAIRDVVAMQERVGLQAATDGEFRRTSWHMDFIYRLGGISSSDEKIQVHFRNADGELDFTTAALKVDGPVRLRETIFGDDYTFLAAYADQVRRVAGLGCRYLQLDDTSLAYLNDPAQRRLLTERGDDAEHQHLRYIKQINAALKDRPAGLTVTTHMCRGNFRSSWAAEGGYDFVAEALFSELGVDAFFLEYDDARSGGFAPLRFVPPGKVVVLGLVTTKRGELESKDDLKRRIDEASRYVPLEQLCLSPQCGFSSTVEGNVLSYDQEVAKLALIVETAAEVWG
jgi:5-methyltetrahydropteroyltriglutamate--homocysteine methyltransferase